MNQLALELIPVTLLGTLLSYAAMVKPYHHKDYERRRQKGLQPPYSLEAVESNKKYLKEVDAEIEEEISIAKRDAVVTGVLFIPPIYFVGRVAGLAVMA